MNTLQRKEELVKPRQKGRCALFLPPSPPWTPCHRGTPSHGYTGVTQSHDSTTFQCANKNNQSTTHIAQRTWQPLNTTRLEITAEPLMCKCIIKRMRNSTVTSSCIYEHSHSDPEKISYFSVPQFLFDT